jgi:hypothetical protein
MRSSRAEIIAAIAEAFFPALEDDAVVARNAGKTSVANLLDTNAKSMDFVIEKVISALDPLYGRLFQGFRETSSRSVIGELTEMHIFASTLQTRCLLYRLTCPKLAQ